MSKHTVADWNQLSDLILANRGKKFQLLSIYGPRGKEKEDKEGQVRKVESITLEITE